jgi:hypothetical protein
MSNDYKIIRAKTAETHRDNLRKRLQHRLTVARANGDTAWIQLLEAEANYLK